MEEFRDYVERIKNLCSLKDIVSEYTKVKKSGSRYVALCPFPDHKEKNPSFTIDENLGLFHCFGCGRGGDVFKFYYYMENYSFMETLEFLSKKYGIEMPKRKKTISEIGKVDIENILRETLNLYKKELFSEGSKGKKYLLERGFTLEEAEEWELGYAPENYGFIKEKLGKKFSEEELFKAGVLAKGERGYYERFRGRLIFPIFSINDRLIGFAGRTLTNETPKYINTQETLSFKKGKVLFGLNRARKKISDFGYIIIVEGYFDCFRLWQAGFDVAVATMGTALSYDHCISLKKITDNLFLCFDSDSAGQSAALSAMKILLPFDFKINLIFLEEGEDPDSYILKYGRSKFEEKINEKLDFYSFLLNREFFTSPKKIPPLERAEKAKKILEYLELIKDQVYKMSLITDLSERTGIPLSSMGKISIKYGEDFKREEREIPDAEKRFLSYFLRNEEVRKNFMERFDPEIFQNPKLKKIAEKIKEKKVDEIKNLQHIIIDEFKEEGDLISEILLLGDEEIRIEEVELLWRSLRENYVLLSIKKINEILKTFKNLKEDERKNFLEKQRELIKELSELKKKKGGSFNWI